MTVVQSIKVDCNIDAKFYVQNFKLIFLSARRVSPFLAWGKIDARSRFARSTIPKEKTGTTRSLRRADLLKIFISATPIGSWIPFAEKCRTVN